MAELFSAFGIEWNLLLAQAVNFGIVLGALTFFLYKPVMKILAERQEKIAAGLRDAEAAAKAVAETEGKRAEILGTAEREAEGLLGRAVVEGKDERARIVKSAQDRSDAMLADARAEAAELQRRALAETEKDVTRLAILAAEKILQKK